MQDINLLPDVERGDPEKSRRKKLIYLACGVVLTILVLFMVGLFGAYALSQKQLSDLQVSRVPLENDIKNHDTEESYYRALVAKTGQIQQILANQPPFEPILSRLLQLQSNGLAYTEVDLTAPNQVIISGRTTNLATLDDFLATLTAKDFGRKTFGNIVLQSLSRDDNGNYTFSARFTYTGEQ